MRTAALASERTNKLLMRRYGLVHRARDADIFGILVGTLAVGRQQTSLSCTFIHAQDCSVLPADDDALKNAIGPCEKEDIYYQCRQIKPGEASKFHGN